jgi:hypothetical protein
VCKFGQGHLVCEYVSTELACECELSSEVFFSFDFHKAGPVSFTGSFGAGVFLVSRVAAGFAGDELLDCFNCLSR